MRPPEVSFHTAGQRVPHNDSYIIVNQAYVQYIPPVTTDARTPIPTGKSTPILFVHGGGLTGAMWESTPDRRPGWAVLASRPPFSRPVYVIDEVDSGRSQRSPDSFRTGTIEHRTAAEVWAKFRLGPVDEINGTELPWDDSQFPLIHRNGLLASQSARRRGTEQYNAEVQGLRDVIAELGECDTIAHSNGCALLALALLEQGTRDNMRQLIMIEPGPPHTQELEQLESIDTLVVWGDHIAGHKMWVPIREHYDKMAGGVEVFDLPAMGIMGNSHFPMLDRNSDETGELVMRWLDET